mgnify:CR=1 FL=1
MLLNSNFNLIVKEPKIILEDECESKIKTKADLIDSIVIMQPFKFCQV